MKKTVLFVTAIALVIAIAATGILAESKTPETGNVDAGMVDETLESEAETNVKISWTRDAALKKSVEEKYTVGTLHDFGVNDWRSMYTDVYVFPLSEYEELDESLQFLKDYDIYLSVTMLPEVTGSSECYQTINECLLDYVEFMREDISSRISDGTMESTFRCGNTGQCINVTSAQFMWDEIFYAVADYYYGYSL